MFLSIGYIIDKGMGYWLERNVGIFFIGHTYILVFDYVCILYGIIQLGLGGNIFVYRILRLIIKLHKSIQIHTVQLRS